jgi:hypothetical protein
MFGEPSESGINAAADTWQNASVMVLRNSLGSQIDSFTKIGGTRRAGTSLHGSGISVRISLAF